MTWRHVILVAGLAALTTPAFAAEARRPLPLSEGARPCPRMGPGFVQLPGSRTCIRLSGRVAAGAGTMHGRRISRDDVVGLGAEGRVGLETRTETEYGPLRGVVRLRSGVSR